MAVSTPGNTFGLCELRSMSVRVTVFALLWCGVEVNIGELGFKVGGLVAVDAGDGTMRSCQREFRLGVVETRQIRPGLVGVASFASHGLPVGQMLHAFPKLPTVWILVTTSAGHVLEVVRHRRFDLGGSLGRGLMTLPASHRLMRSRQYEP